ncbi:hypothetical protein [Corynebacterium callunae]|uniref:hypothetical protein n=1 Tax=Corynebacterium callunae TaxID=1721 RepID=UPI001FFE6CD5|nr:hypothetical protein [Corynebacterium callunae]MCK2200572.1 hypothetical protein [Corynebacterium callunae]
MFNQLFIEKVFICSKGDKEHHTHIHLNPWTLVFCTTNIAQNEAMELDHKVEENPDLDEHENSETSARIAENTEKPGLKAWLFC